MAYLYPLENGTANTYYPFIAHADDDDALLEGVVPILPSPEVVCPPSIEDHLQKWDDLLLISRIIWADFVLQFELYQFHGS